MGNDKEPIEGRYTVVGEVHRPAQGAREPIIKSWKGLLAFIAFFLLSMAASWFRHR
jgi:hypothetical protein